MKLSDDFLLMLERLSIAARRMSAGLPHGTHLSRRRGPSVEFRDHRAYSPGDELRYIDWNATARLGHPFVKEFTAEEALHVGILVDVSASMGFGTPSKFETAQTVAAALAYIGMAGLDAVSLHAFGERLRTVVPAARGKQAVHPLFRALEQLRPEGRTDFAACFGDPPEALRARSTLFLITDFYDSSGTPAAVAALRKRRCEVNLIHLMSPEELEPPAGGRVLLEDLETGERRRVTMTPRTRDAYRRALDRHLEALAALALENELGYVRISSADPVEQTVTRILQESRMLQRRK